MDLLTFVPNINTFRLALRNSDSEFVHVNEANEVKLLIDNTPVKFNGNKTLTLLRCTAEQKTFLESIPSVSIIGEYQGGEDYIFYSDVVDRGKYGQVYDQSPREVDDGDGGTVMYTPPKMIGIFAD